MQRRTLPTLIVCGAGDVPLMAKNAAHAAAIAGSRVEPYEGAPHGLFLTDPARFNRDLPGFIRSV
jgi:non-heme chloroperoxidase